MIKRGKLSRLSLFISFAWIMFGCDSTVGLDPTLPSFTKALVAGTCPLEADGSRLRMSVLLSDGKKGLEPDDKIQRAPEPVLAMLTSDSFQFAKASADTDVSTDKVGVVVPLREDGVELPQKKPTNLNTVGRSYAYAGGEMRRFDKRLLVLVLDHSGTLKGIDPADGMLRTALRTDGADERITFFTQLVNNLPVDEETNEPLYQVAVVRMNDKEPKIVDCLNESPPFSPCPDMITQQNPRLCSIAYADVNLATCAVQSLERGAGGYTPLNDTLKEVYDLVLTRSYPTLNPVVILFTDGLEEMKDGSSGGDASIGYEIGTGKPKKEDENGEPIGYRDILAANQARDLFVAGVAPNNTSIPIIVMHLQPPASSPYKRGRDPRLQQLACDTGGEYLFLENAGVLTKNSNLQDIVRDRIRGAFQIEVETDLDDDVAFEPGDYLLSTSLQVRLGDVQRTVSLSKAKADSGPAGFNTDTRLWLTKYPNE